MRRSIDGMRSTLHTFIKQPEARLKQQTRNKKMAAKQLLTAASEMHPGKPVNIEVSLLAMPVSMTNHAVFQLYVECTLNYTGKSLEELALLLKLTPATDETAAEEAAKEIDNLAAQRLGKGAE